MQTMRSVRDFFLAMGLIISLVKLSEFDRGSSWPELWKPNRGAARGQITPNSIRVEPLDGRGEEGWITLEGYAEIGSPCISPDDQFVAFDARKQGFGKSPAEIWMANRDGSHLHFLTQGFTSRWSPDGRQLLFGRTDPLGIPYVWIIQADGSSETRICEGGWPEWSPDGSQIAFSKGGQPGGGAKAFSQIYVAKVDGSEAEHITGGDCPSWSPDGKTIACCFRDLNRGNPLIRIVDLESRKERLLGVGWFRANWTSDSQAVVANGPQSSPFLRMNRLAVSGGGAPRAIPSRFENPASPHESPDGSYLVFVAQKPD